MFIRSTKRKNRDGTLVEYIQLAHNVRDPETRKPVAKIIHSFGRADSLDRQALVRLCQSISRVCGVTIEVPDADTSGNVRTAQGRSRQENQLWPEYLTQRTARALGTILVIETFWERLGLGPLLRAIAVEEKCPRHYERALLAMTANRLCEPMSKLGAWDRWLPRVYLPSCWELKLDHMYEAMDMLHLHAERVEERIFFQTANLFNLDVDVVFYDTTTASFSVDFEDEDEPPAGSVEGNDGKAVPSAPGLRQRGKSKNGTWNPQVIVALAVTREGIPVRSWVFPGNTTDVTTVETVKKDLRGWNLNRCLFVADAGMNSEANRKTLSLGGGRYLLAVRAGSVKEVQEEVLTRGGRYKTVADNLQVKEVEVGKGELRRRYFVCYNPKEAERQKRHREAVLQYLREELDQHQDWDAKAKWAIELLASERSKRYLGISTAGKVFIDQAKVKRAEKFDGKWVLITNDDTLNPEDAASGYKALLVIERCFRTLKSTQIHLTPMNHWLARRIETHVKICVLALWIQRVVERTSGKTWGGLRYLLEDLQATEYETPTHRFFRRNEPSHDLAAIMKTLNISMDKHILSIIPLEEKP
jgi:hypothetical protein